MRAQKERCQARIRAWHASECREAIIRDEVIPEWRAGAGVIKQKR